MRQIFLNQSVLLTLFVSLLLLPSCKKRIQPDTPDKLFDKYRNCVVLIRNQYYYQIDLSNGLNAYFTELENGEISDLTFDEDEAKKNGKIIYGTGFFITSDGKIATNRHIATPTIDDANALNSLKLKFDAAKYKIQEYQEELTQKIFNIESYVTTNYAQLEYTSIQALKDKRLELLNDRDKLSYLNVAFDFEPSKSTIKTKSVSIGIALENTFVTKSSDFRECVVINNSSEKGIDIALIQLKDKQTPISVKNIFDFSEHNPNIKNGTSEEGEQYDLNKPLKIDTKVYMIGFNYGYEIGNTSEGLKAQLTQGTISQESDKTKVLYSIPSLQGSSGSPIIDQWGNLVAINFAKVSNTQSFNYGILAKHLKELSTK